MLLHYRELGCEHSETIVILHGLWGAGENYLPIAKELSRNYRLVLPDMRNHGNSFHSDVMDYDVMADDVYRLLCCLHIGRCHIVGHSMGAKVGLRLKMLHPEIFATLMVLDIVPKDYEINEEHRCLVEFISRDLIITKSRSELKNYIAEYLKNEDDIQIILKSITRRNTVLTWKIGVEGISKNIGNLLSWNWDGLESGRFDDVVFVKADRSYYIDDADLDYIRNFYVINDSSHWILRDNPRALLSLVRDVIRYKSR